MYSYNLIPKNMSKEKNNILKTIINGPSLGYTDVYPKRELWRDIANEFNGTFKIKHNSGCELEWHDVTIPYKRWEIKISSSDTRPLKFTASLLALQHFDLTISWEDFIERILEKFSKPEIEVGYKEFDKRYLIKSNRSDLTKAILSDSIQRTMLKHNIYSLSYQTNKNSNESELICTIQRKAGDKGSTIELTKMFMAILDNINQLKIIK